MELPNDKIVENAITWIDELSETTLSQGRGRLGDEEYGFCCLGVGCHVLNIKENPYEPFSRKLKYKIGLRTPNGMFKKFEYINDKKQIDFVDNLGDVNDILKYSFSEISEFIKTRLDEIFISSVAIELKKHYGR